MNIFDEIKRLKERVIILEDNHKPKEKPDASINSMDNKDLPDGSNTQASSRDTGGLPRKKLKKQARRQTVGASKKDIGQVSAKESSQTN